MVRIWNIEMKMEVFVKLKFNAVAMLLCAVSMVLQGCGSGSGPVPADPVFLADPFILEQDGKFYAYGTDSDSGIAVYVSDDLEHWEGPCGAAEGGLALHKDDSWGDFWFWAPEVYRVGDRYVMTYSVQEHIAVAFSDSPLGPFRQEEPMQPYIPGQKGIDSHIFVDDDSSAWLYWVRWDLGNGNEIHVAPLSLDFRQLDTSAQKVCIVTRPDTWEAVPDGARVAEGPFVLKHGGLYYLSFSCNDYKSREYAVGYAVAPSPQGPWERYEGNPILHRQGGYVGTGHHSFLRTSKGKMYIVYHAHLSSDHIHPRKMLISPCSFVRSKDGPDVLSVGKKVIVPILHGN